MNRLGFSDGLMKHEVRIVKETYDKEIHTEIKRGNYGVVLIGSNLHQSWRERLLYRERRKVVALLGSDSHQSKILVPVDLYRKTLLLLMFLRQSYMDKTGITLKFLHVLAGQKEPSQKLWQELIKIADMDGDLQLKHICSVASLKPPLEGEFLTENSPTNGYVPYEKSKAIGEALLSENSHRVPAVALRLGGVFSDWCELPPLYSLIKLWSKRNIIGRMIPGKGYSGFPYIHRYELVRIIRRVIEKINNLDRFEILFASEDGCTRHKDLFPIIRCASGKKQLVKPIHISPTLARMTLFGKYYLNIVLKKKTYERSWMINYIDHPIVVDTTYSRKKMNWAPNSEFYILKRLPLIMNHFTNQRAKWEKRNLRRNEGMYEYQPDCQIL